MGRVTHSDQSHTAMTVIAHVAVRRGNYEEAIRWARRALSASANFGPAHWQLIAGHHYLGQHDEARKAAEIYMKRSPNATIPALRRPVTSGDNTALKVIIEALRAAGVPER